MPRLNPLESARAEGLTAWNTFLPVESVLEVDRLGAVDFAEEQVHRRLLQIVGLY